MKGMTDKQLQTIATETNTPRGKLAREILKQREIVETKVEKPKRRSRKKANTNTETE